jgi:peptidoglycan-associated lipoprotein
VKIRNPLFGRTALLCLLAMVIGGIGCKHPVASTPATTPTPTATTAPPARPTVTLQASSTFIQKGDSTTLSWSSTNATTLALAPGVGSVSPEGSQKVSPTDSTTYTITATGPGGTADQSVRITVGAANVEQPATAAALVPFGSAVTDAFFDYNKSDLRPDARDALSKDAVYLRQHPEIRFVIQGYCDERGTTEYNLGLGQRRADAVKEFLVSLGVGADRIQTVSFGKEKQFCTEHNETCWQQNRRGHFERLP